MTGHSTSKKQQNSAPKNDNRTLLGDPVSLKAETADSEPTEHGRGARNGKKQSTFSPSPSASAGLSHEEEKLNQGRTLKGMMKDDIKQAAAQISGKGGKGVQNRSMLGDPISLKAETSKDDPVDGDNGPSSDQDGKSMSGKPKL